MAPRVALISLYDHYAFGIRSLHSVLKKNKIDASCIFYKYFKLKMGPSSEKELDILIGLLKDLSVDIVGVSVSSTFFNEAARLTDRLKDDLDIAVFWEGFHPTIMPGDCIKFADFVFIGEAEETLLHLINNRDEIYALHIPGVWARRGKEIIKESTPQRIENLNSLPMPDFDDANKYYIEEDELFCADPLYNPRNFSELYKCRYHILSSRGCPFNCSYCYNPALKNLHDKCDKSYIRKRGVGSVIRELGYAKERLGAKCIIFTDSCFPANIQWVSDFCKLYKDKIRLPFYCEMHPEIINEEVISMLCDAGLNDTCIGIQSGSERIRHRYFNRPVPDELFLNKTKLLKKYNIDIHYEIITDNPYEQENDKHETLKLLLKLPRPLKLNVFSLNFFPGAEITRRALADGLISEKDVEGRSNRGMRQFLLKKPQDAKDLFWNYIYFLAADYYCSSGNTPGLRGIFSNDLILFLSNLKLIKKFPWIFIKAVNLLNKSLLMKRKVSNWLKKYRRPFPKSPMLFLRILLLACFIPILIKFIKPKKVFRILTLTRKQNVDNQKLAKVIRYVNFIVNLKPWQNLKNICLIRSTIFYHFLRSEGLNVRINFGVKKENGILKGHSWLTLNGEAYLEVGRAWENFESVYSFPS